MPLVEILDGPPEWAGVAYETDEDMVASEIGLSHPRWRGTPVRVRWGALYAYKKVEVVGDRHRYRYQGPWPQWRRRLGMGEDLTGWDVLVVQQELDSDDPRKLWGSPVRVFAAPPGTPPARPGPAARGAGLAGAGRGRPAASPQGPGHGRVSPGAAGPPDGPGEPVGGRTLAAAGRPAGCGQGRRGRADRTGAGADGSCGQGGQGAAAAATRCGGLLDQRPAVPRQGDLRPDDRCGAGHHRRPGQPGVDGPAGPRGPGRAPERDLDDDDGPLYGFARLYSAPPATLPPNPAVASEEQGWAELAEGDFLLPWLLHITRYEL